MRKISWTAIFSVALILFSFAAMSSAASNADWKKLYIDYINGNPGSEPDLSGYSLIYINDDDIPELWIDYGLGFEGYVLCSVSDGKLEVAKFSHCGLAYIELQNLFVIGGGRMDHYYDEVYRIQNGKFTRLHRGNYGAEDNSNVQRDAEGNPVYRYYWDGKEVSENEYERALSSAFDDSKAAAADENSSSAREIIPRIRLW